MTQLAADGHAIVASASRPHFMECPQQMPTLSNAMRVPTTRMRLLLLGLLCASCARYPRPAALQPDASLVGRRFVESLAGTTTRAARLVTTPGDVEYAVHHVDSPAGERLIITRVVGRDAANRPEYEVMAALVLPPRSANEILVVGACTIDGAQDVDIVAVARRTPRAELSRIRGAWRANGPLRTLAPVATAGIRCENEGWQEP